MNDFITACVSKALYVYVQVVSRQQAVVQNRCPAGGRGSQVRRVFAAPRHHHLINKYIGIAIDNSPDRGRRITYYADSSGGFMGLDGGRALDKTAAAASM